LKHHDDDVLLPPPPPPSPYWDFGVPSELEKDKLSKYPPLIPVPNPSDTSIGDAKSILSYCIAMLTVVNKNYKREVIFLDDLSEQLTEMGSERHADYSTSDPSFAAISLPETFHLQPRGDVHPNAPDIAGATSDLLARDQVYQQTPTSTTAASQLLLLPVLAICYKSLREAFRLRSGGNGGRHRKRAIYSGARRRREHARSWRVSGDVHMQEGLD